MSDKTTGQASPTDTVNELKVMVTDYAKQETVEPLKRLGHWVKWGVVGAFFVVFGVALLTLGALRVIQEEASFLDDGWSWVPYLIVFGGLLVVLILAGFGLKRSIDLTDGSES